MECFLYFWCTLTETLDDAFKWMSKIDKFEQKHFQLRPEYRVIGELMNRLKVAEGKDKFILQQKLNRAMRLVEWKEAYDPNNPANFGVIQHEQVGPSADLLEHAGFEKEKQMIQGDDDDEEEFDDMKERDDILLEKLNAIDKKLEEKLAELDHTFGKKGKILEEEIRDLAEERNELTEKKRRPLYRKVSLASFCLVFLVNRKIHFSRWSRINYVLINCRNVSCQCDFPNFFSSPSCIGYALVVILGPILCSIKFYLWIEKYYHTITA